MRGGRRPVSGWDGVIPGLSGHGRGTGSIQKGCWGFCLSCHLPCERFYALGCSGNGSGFLCGPGKRSGHAGCSPDLLAVCWHKVWRAQLQGTGRRRLTPDIDLLAMIFIAESSDSFATSRCAAAPRWSPARLSGAMRGAARVRSPSGVCAVATPEPSCAAGSWRGAHAIAPRFNEDTPDVILRYSLLDSEFISSPEHISGLAFSKL